MTFDDARIILGLGHQPHNEAELRAAYLRAIRLTHPDLHARTSATEESTLVVTAYTLLSARLAEGAQPADRLEAESPAAPPSSVPPAPSSETTSIVLIADDTIEVGAPMDEVFSLLLEAGHNCGEITFLDRSGAVMQILISFVDQPICQLVVDLQGRAARGTTEIFCTIESLDDAEPPAIARVAKFVADQMAELVALNST